jgi:hypothetical protein
MLVRLHAKYKQPTEKKEQSSYRLSLSEHAQNAENGNEEERKLHLDYTFFAVEMNVKAEKQSRQNRTRRQSVTSAVTKRKRKRKNAK